MAIRSKYQLGPKKRSVIINKEFTNRIEARKFFLSNAKNIERTELIQRNYKILVYYGIGGIGKSSLQNQLKKELMDNCPQAQYTFIDFIDPLFRNSYRAILELKRNIFGPKKMSFPHFDLAYSIYFKKKNPDYIFNKKKLPFESEASIVGDILGAFDGFGIVGAVTGIVNKSYEMLSKIGLDKSIKKELELLENLTPFEIEQRLPAFFSYDLNVTLKKKILNLFVIFLDTYEAIWSYDGSKGNKYSKDDWVRELVSHLPQCLFVISGREKIHWEEIDQDWDNYIEYHLLDCLHKDDAEEFLIKCEIKNRAIRDKIIIASEGHPYHLDLSVDTYYELVNQDKEITLQQFGANRKEILNRFFTSLYSNEIEVLKVLAIPRYYNLNIFQYIIRAFNIHYPISSFTEFNRFSFISQRKESLFFHSLMRDSLLAFTDRKNIVTAHKLMAAYYEEKLKNAEKVLNQDLIIKFFSESFYHHSNYLNNSSLINWLSDEKFSLLKYLQYRGATKYLESIFSDLIDKVGLDTINTKLFEIYVDMVHLKGEYKRAVALIDDFLQPFKRMQIINSDELTHLLIRKVHHQMFYMPVWPLIEELEYIVSLIDKKKYPDRYNELLFMLGGNLGVLTGNYNFARKWLIKSIRFSIQNNYPSYLCRTLRKYSDILRFQNHLKFANKACDWALDIAREHNYKRYEIYLICSKGEIEREQGNLGKALNHFEEAKRSAKSQGIKGWIGHTYLALAEIYQTKNDLDEAKINFNKAQKIYEQIGQVWGEMQVKIGYIRYYLSLNDSKWKRLSNEVLQHAQKMGYQKEINITKFIVSNEASTNNKLMFL